jgi:CRP/FNR family transcriptional regulator, cyclic AMP receptor protein
MKRERSAASFLATLAEGRTTRLYRTDQRVFGQGDPSDAVFYLRSGAVELTTVSPRGKDGAVGTLHRGAFFGESCLGGQSVRLVTARACAPSAVVRVERDAMVGLLRREPRFADLFTAHVLSRNARTEQDLIGHIFLSSEKRLAGALLSLARLGRAAGPAMVRPPLTDGALALMLGVTRAHVRELMQGFRKMGFIAGDRGSLVVRSGLLGVVLHE